MNSDDHTSDPDRKPISERDTVAHGAQKRGDIAANSRGKASAGPASPKCDDTAEVVDELADASHEASYSGSHSVITKLDTPRGWQLCKMVFARLVRAAAVGLAFSSLVALFDAIQVLRATPEAPSPPRLWLSDLGLVAPLCLAVSICGAAFAELLHSPDVPSWIRFRRWLRPVDTRRRARLAAILLVAPLACVLGCLALARVAVLCLSLPAPPNVVGALLAAAVAGASLIAVGAVLFVGRTLGIRLRSAPPDPMLLAGVGLGVALVLLLALIAFGDTAGAGSPLAILGVFRRQELDLRASSLLLLIFVCGYASNWLSSLAQKRRRIAAACTLIPLMLTFYDSRWGLNVRAIALSIERSAPVGKLMLGPLRRATDRDKDGFSSAFGGGDCNDKDPSINPGADDVPGNRVDEDCSGGDAVVQQPVVASQAAQAGDWRALIPKDLNVVFLSIDTVRADVLSDPRPVTPRLRGLAERGTVYTNAYSPASYTGKSVGPFVIGKNSSETNRDFSHFNAFKRERFVQQRLQEHGIRTISVQGYWYFYSPPYGFEKGFDVIDSAASSGQGYVEGDRTSNADKQADRVIAQLGNAENTSKQFYLWAHFTDPHAEYVKHANFDFGNDAKSKYLGEVAFVDAQIGRILDAIAYGPLREKTAIIVTSDHGEAFGEHGMFRHGFELWEPLVRVPLIFYVPGAHHQSISVRRSLIDLVPTMLDLMGVPVPSGQDGDFVSGQSLAPEIISTEADVARPRPVFIDMSAGPNNAERQAFIENDLKLILSNGRPLGLYDLAADPEEKHDLLDQSERRAQVLADYKQFRRNLRVIRINESRPN